VEKRKAESRLGSAWMMSRGFAGDQGTMDFIVGISPTCGLPVGP